MKSIVKLLIWAVPFMALRVLPAIFIGVLVLGVSFAQAAPLPPATATIGVGAYTNTCSDGQCINVSPPVTYPLTGYSATDSVSYINTYYNGTISGQGAGNASASFDSAIVSGFSVPVAAFGSAFADGTASVQFTGGCAGNHSCSYMTQWGAGGGTVDSYFRIDQIQIPMFGPSGIPIIFEAAGGGAVISGYGYFVESAVIAGVPGASIALPPYEGYAHSATLPGGHMDITGLTPGTTYMVQVNANAWAYAWGWGTDMTSEVTVSIDPAIGFDQAAFDAYNAANGLSTYNLADYFAIELSPNVPLSTTVPEPTTMLLLGLGLVGLARARRKFKK